MTPSEAAVALAKAAAFDNRKPTEVAARAWAEAMPSLPLRDVLTAITEHYAESREFIMPADIRRRVGALRAARLAAHPPVEPPAGLDEAAYRRWLRQVRSAIADGRPLPAELEAPTTDRPVAALTTRAFKDARS